VHENKKVKPLVVLDTNVILSYLWSSANCLRIIRAMLLENRYTPVVSTDMLNEFDDVVSRIKIKRRIGEIAPMIFRREYLLFARCVYPQNRVSLCDDPDDNALLECAQESGADFLVTGDDDLLRLEKFGKTKIVTPAEFIRCFLNA
jgi:putative PIN family toxin of toxin-antitoxin system